MFAVMTRTERGQRLREAREKKKLSAPVAGQEIGVTARTIQRWERGDTEPTIDQLTKLLRLYGAKYERIFDDSARAA